MKTVKAVMDVIRHRIPSDELGVVESHLTELHDSALCRGWLLGNKEGAEDAYQAGVEDGELKARVVSRLPPA